MKESEIRKAMLEEMQWMNVQSKRCKDCKHLMECHCGTDAIGGSYCLLDTCNCTKFEKED